VLVEVGARVGVETALGSTGLAVAGRRAGAAWAGSVGLMASVAVVLAVGGAAAQAARRTAAKSPDTWVTRGNLNLTRTILRPTVRSVNSQVGGRPLVAMLISAEGLREGQVQAGDGVCLMVWVESEIGKDGTKQGKVRRRFAKSVPVLINMLSMVGQEVCERLELQGHGYWLPIVRTHSHIEEMILT